MREEDKKSADANAIKNPGEKVIEKESGNCAERIMSENYLDYFIEQNVPINAGSGTVVLTPGGGELTKDEEDCFIQIAPVLGLTFRKIENEAECTKYYTDIPYQLVPYLYNGIGQVVKSHPGETNVLNFDASILKDTGQDVIIGVISTGINYEHPVFLNKEGKTKIISIWDQSIENGVYPKGFTYGHEITRDEINVALSNKEKEKPLTVDEVGQGTFLAGVAAGSAVEKNNFKGIAPDAELLVVKLKKPKQCLRNFYLAGKQGVFFSEGDVILAVDYIINKANELNKPLVLLYGGATDEGSHEGQGNLERYVFSRYGRNNGIVITIPAGDEANKAHHYRGYLTERQREDTFNIDFSADVGGVVMNLWVKLPDMLTIEIFTPSGNSTGVITTTKDKWEDIKFNTEDSLLKILIIPIEESSGDQAIFVHFVDPVPGLWTVKVAGTIVVTGIYDAWILSFGKEKEAILFPQPDSYVTTTSPSNTESVITVGAYDYKTDGIYIPSGRGNTRNNRLKPDLVAPGVDLLGPYYEGDGFGVMTGTSVAAAVVAGSAALLLQWSKRNSNEYMNTISTKTFLMQGARRRPHLAYPNRQWGYGELDIKKTFDIIGGE